MDEIIEELKELVAKLEAAQDGEDTTAEEQRIEELTAELEERSAGIEAAQTRSKAVENARKAIENGEARKMEENNVIDMTKAPEFTQADYRSAWLKELATRGGVQLVGGNDMTPAERAAYNHTATNTAAVIPTDLADEIISLIERTAVLYGDIRKSNFKHQFELVRHTEIAKGDAAKTNEGAAPDDDEQNAFANISLTGVEIKKTVKMSRKLAVQSMDGFENYIMQEIADRVAVAADKFVLERIDDTDLGIAEGNKVKVATSGTLTKADLMGAIAKTRSFGAAPKGRIVYANSGTIWKHIATLEDANKRAYFVDEKTEDPCVQGRIFGCQVKVDENIADDVILVGYPDTMQGNDFDGVDVTAYVATDGTQNHCFDGYLLFDAGMREPLGFAKLECVWSA